MLALRHKFSLFGRACRAVKKWLIGVLYILLGVNGVLMVLAAALQIASRLLGRPVAWTVELLLFLGLYSIIPGSALIFLKSEEIEVSFIVDLLPRPLRTALECFTSAACMVYGVFLFISNVNYSYLVNLGSPEQFLPFPPVANILPVYLLAFAIFWDMARKLKETILRAASKTGPKETGPR
jgi:TRAP-type C4-dicarboxylate transport system permease small subunit